VDLQRILQLDTADLVPALLVEKVDLLKDKQYGSVSAMMPATVKMAVELGVPMITVQVATKEVQAFIEFELIKLSAMVNIDQRLTIQKHQVPVIAQELYEAFKSESIEDISVCFRRGAMGTYGEIYRLDGAVLAGWMRAYLEEKYNVIEANLRAEKDNIYQVKRTAAKPEFNPERNLLSLLETVVTGKPINIDLSKHLTPEELKEVEAAQKKGFRIADKNNSKSNDYERYKLERQERKAFQDKLNRVASDFYEKKESYGEIKTWEDDNGFYVLAENQQDADHIYNEAKKT
jgi:hypothetical protein